MTQHKALRIGVVGLGQCGGRFAAALFGRGYPALAVNTSQTDLQALEGLSDEQRLYVGIEGLNGTGGAVAVGAECLAARGDEVKAAVDSWSDVSALCVVAGLGGGTGGNLGELVTLLSGESRPVIALAVLPASSEGHTAKVTALQSLNALLDASFDSLVMVDNQKVHQAFSSAGVDRFLAEGNGAVAEAFDGLNALAADGALRPLRAHDPAELAHTLLSGGAVVFDRQTVAEPLTAEGLVSAVRAVVTDHPLLGAGYALEDAVVVSAVVVASKDVLADTPAAVFAEFAAALRAESDDAVLHQGLYAGEVSPAELYVMVGGLPLPPRAQELLDEAAAEAERLAAKPRPKKRLQKLDLSGLAAFAASRGLVPPSTGGKGMAKIRAEPLVAEPAEDDEPPMDLDFDGGDAPPVDVVSTDAVVEEEVEEER